MFRLSLLATLVKNLFAFFFHAFFSNNFIFIFVPVLFNLLDFIVSIISISIISIILFLFHWYWFGF